MYGFTSHPRRFITYDGLTTEHTIYLLQPVNVGFSYGARVDNSRDAASDVYDFLQKFYVILPQLSRYRPSNGSSAAVSELTPILAHPEIL